MNSKCILIVSIICSVCIVKGFTQKLNCYPKQLPINCSNNCANLILKAPSVKSTEDYTYKDIPYQPYDFVTPTATTDATLYADDRHSAVFNLPFNFCFYDTIFTKAIISSNGYISFQTALAGGGSVYTATTPIPTISYPRASIMGAFNDLDASPQVCPPVRKIEWRLEGTAPYRRFVISFYNVGNFVQGVWSATGTNCNSLNPNTFQMVLYESTSFIEIYIKKKICQSFTSNGSILGIQNWARNKAITAPGKNGVSWTSIEQGFGFVPSGSITLIQSATLHKLNGTILGNLELSNINSDSTTFTYNNYCLTNATTDTLIIKALYNSCSGGLPYTLSDTIYVNKESAGVPVLQTTNALCNGVANGTIKVTNGSVGTTYSIDDVNYQSSNIFNVAAGNYIVYKKEINNCIQSTTTTVTEPQVITINTVITTAQCTIDGNVVITSSGGTAPYLYSKDGVTYVTTNSINVQAGNNTVYVKDANNCVKEKLITVGLTNTLFVNTIKDTTICEANTIQLNTVSNGTTFIWNPSSNLSNATILSPIATPVTNTKYYITATLGGCIKNDSVTVSINTAPIANAGSDTSFCVGKSYELQGSGGSTYKWQPSTGLSNSVVSNPTTTPNNSIKYWLSVIDNKGCKSLIADTVSINVTPPIIAYVGRDTTILLGHPYQLQAIGAIFYTWTPTIGLSNPNIANPVAILYNAQTYTVKATTADGCVGEATITLTVLKGPGIYVPTAFTPNNDGLNDQLKIFAVGVAKFNYFKIFNRYGIMIFYSTNINNTWNATYKGIPQPTGTYIYMVSGNTENGREIYKKGTVVLLR